jgi:redox-sensitive bicupin YhaK (pirin superfamily)
MTAVNDPASLPEVEAVLVPPVREISEDVHVRRALPSAQHMMVGPFIFFDQFGPTYFKDGRGLDVRPHPHIGLATVTYLFEGEILHRDNVGSVQPIHPGEVNWMTAGRGIVHSERSSPRVRERGGRLSGIQVWLALPKSHEEIEPSFIHHDASEIPEFHEGNVRVRLIAGTMQGVSSPVKVFTSMFYADVAMEPHGVLALPDDHEERALYIAEGAIEIQHARVDAGKLVIARLGKPLSFKALTRSRIMLLGGERADAPRHIWWNFVSSSLERIHQAKEDWVANRYAPVPGETEFIPAPEQGPAKVVDYP